MTPARRFWSDVTVADGGIRLDDRPLRTPSRAPLLLPTRDLAEAVAAEWRDAGATIDPQAMPLTGLANAAIDRIASDPARFVADIAAYASSDLTCYRADTPADLIAAQAAAWDDPLLWASGRYGVVFTVTRGIMPVAQPHATLDVMAAAVSAYDAFHLAALQRLVTLSGSLVLTLALAEGTIDEDRCWAAAEVDTTWQAARWGDDPSAAVARADKRAAFAAAARFLRLL